MFMPENVTPVAPPRACGAGFERGYRSLRLTMQSGIQIAEQVRQQTMEEVA